MAGDAISAFGEHLVDAAPLDPVEHGGEARALRFVDPGRAADGAIVEFGDDGPAFGLGPRAARGKLILD